MRFIGFIAFAVLLFSGCSKSVEPSDEIVKVISSCGSSAIVVTDIKGAKRVTVSCRHKLVERTNQTVICS